MAILNIRNLPDDVHAKLRVRAARAGRSMEAEARAILSDAVTGAEETLDVNEIQARVAALYRGRKPLGVVDDLIAERRREADLEQRG